MGQARSLVRYGALATAALLLAACGVGSSGQATTLRPRTRASPTPVAAVLQQARRFMQLMVAGDFAAQWELLTPQAQQQWPSAQARTDMLEAKFGGAPIAGFTLGTPTPDATWTSRENLVTMPGVWQVPVSITFRDPSNIRPQAAVAAYQQELSLALTPPSGRQKPELVGEGPASLDAPVILPARIPDLTTHVPILMYHRVAPYPNRAAYRTTYDWELDYGLTVDPAEFQGQVQYLAQNGYVAISLTRLADHLLYGLPLPAKAVVFTFDDGRMSPYTYAVPTLRKYGFTATFFVPAGLVGWEPTRLPLHYLTQAQISQLAQTGFWIEDHTLKDNVPLWSVGGSELQQLALDTRTALESISHQPIQWIAYTGQWPYPSATTAGPAEEQLFQELAAMGYVGGVVDASIDSTNETSQQLWQLPRVRVGPNEPLSTFVADLG
jgi:peptidoglycan/xylan/chitin deacetylase (PgdA/CDA1 family)